MIMKINYIIDTEKIGEHLNLTRDLCHEKKCYEYYIIFPHLQHNHCAEGEPLNVFFVNALNLFETKLKFIISSLCSFVAIRKTKSSGIVFIYTFMKDKSVCFLSNKK